MSHSGRLFQVKAKPDPAINKTYLTLSDLNSLFNEFNTFFTTYFCADAYPYSLIHRSDEDPFYQLKELHKQQMDSGMLGSHFHSWCLTAENPFYKIKESDQQSIFASKILKYPFYSWFLTQDLRLYQIKEECSLTLQNDVLKKEWHNDGYFYQRMEPLENSKFFMARFGKLTEIPIKAIQTFDKLCMSLLAGKSTTTLTKQQMENLAQGSSTIIPSNYYINDKRMKAFDCADFSYILSAWLTKIIRERNISNLHFSVISSHEPDVGNHTFTLISIDPNAQENPYFFLHLLKKYGYPIAEHPQSLLDMTSSSKETVSPYTQEYGHALADHPQGLPDMTSSSKETVSPYTVAWDPFNPGGAKHRPTTLKSFSLNQLPYYLFNWDAKSMVPGKRPLYTVDFELQTLATQFDRLNSKPQLEEVEQPFFHRSLRARL